MDARKLMTLGFDRNVGTADRIFRLASGGAVAGAGWYLGAPAWGAVAMSVLGGLWMLTGVLSKCSVYYLMGYSTCPVAGEGAPPRKG